MLFSPKRRARHLSWECITKCTVDGSGASYLDSSSWEALNAPDQAPTQARTLARAYQLTCATILYADVLHGTRKRACPCSPPPLRRCVVVNAPPIALHNVIHALSYSISTKVSFKKKQKSSCLRVRACVGACSGPFSASHELLSRYDAFGNAHDALGASRMRRKRRWGRPYD